MKPFIFFIVLAFPAALLAPGRSPATVDVSTARNDYYPTNGTTTSFPYTFRILDKAHLEVVDVDAAGVESVKTVDTDYTVDGVGNPAGGSVAFWSAPPSGHRIVILRKQPVEQSSDYMLNEGFPSDRVEKDLDKQAMVDQMQNEQLGRALKLPKRSPMTNVTIPPPSECNLATNRFLAWKTDGTNIECAAGPTGPTGPVGPGAPGVNEATLQSGSLLACADGGSTDSYACNMTPALASYTTGMVIFLKANTANTGAATLNVNSLGAKAITKNKGVALADNDIKAGQWIPLIYDGTNFEIFNGIPNNGTAGGGGVTVLDQTATDVTVGNTTTETTVYSKSIPGGTLGTVGKLRLTLHWRQKNNAGGDGISLTVRCKFGATTLITENTGDINMTAFGDQTSIFELMADMVTNAQLAKSLHIGINNGVASLFTGRGTASEDSTTAKTLVVTFQWSAAGGANQSSVMEHATLELVK